MSPRELPPSADDASPVRIPKGPDEELRGGLDSLQGHPFLNLRTWWLTPEGTWRPTKRGITLHVDDLPVLVAGLRTLEADAVKRGWLDAADVDAGRNE